jgi:hypothetical protein
MADRSRTQNQVVFWEIAARSPGHPEYCLYKNIYGVHQFTLYLALLAHVILIDDLENLHQQCNQFYASVPIWSLAIFKKRTKHVVIASEVKQPSTEF